MKRLRTMTTLLMAVLIMLMSFTSITAYATENTIETGVSTVVIDKAGMLSEDQVTEIENAVSGLTRYKVALYIENCEESKCTQKYTNDLVERLYKEQFSDNRNCIMIAFSFYDDACGYYAVHCGANVTEVKESRVKNLIEGTYHDYPTDSTWVTGSFVQCVDYFKEVELNVTNKEAKPDDPEKTKTIALIVLQVTILSGMVAVIVYLAYTKRRDELAYEDALYKSQKVLTEEQAKSAALQSDLNVSKNEVDILQEWKNNAIRADVTIQDRIDVMLAQDAATAFNQRFVDVEQLEAVADNFNYFHSAMQAYEKMNDTQKSFVTVDMNVVSNKRQISAELYAKEAETYINNFCTTTMGNRQARGRINETIRYYERIPNFVRVLMAVHVYQQLNNLRDEAETDHKRYQRRNSSSSRSYNSGARTFGGGFSGGRTFGGGFRGGH